MKATINDGKLCIDVNDVIDELTTEEKLEFASSLVWEDTVLREVVRVLSDDLATDGFNYNIFEMRKLLAEKMPDVLRSLVQGILMMWLREKKERQRADTWAWKMYHAWPEEYRKSRPELEPYEPIKYLDDAEIDRIITAVTRELESAK